jgi:two-component system, cell cycle sensor histidine kinase and response regulator CckA
MPSPHPTLRCMPLVLFSCLLIAIGLSAPATAQSDQSGDARSRPDFTQPLSQRQPLIVGITSDSYPHGFVNDRGEWVGFSTDLFDAVARVMNIQFRRVSAPGKELFARFKAGEFDLLQAYSQTTERETYAEFSFPYLTLQGAVFIRDRDSPIKTLGDFNGRKFAVIGQGSIGDEFIRDQRLAVQAVYVSSSGEALGLVNSGECAGTFMSRLTALSVIERNNLHDVVQFGQPLADYDIRHCFAVHKGDARLLARINEGLAILQRSGEFQAIHRKWFGRFETTGITREEVVTWGLGVLVVALLITVAAYLRQRNLRRRIALQAAELAAQQQLLQALYDNIPFVMCLLEGDPGNPRVLSLNRQAEPYFGVAARDAIGRPLGELPLDPEWARHLRDLLSRGPNHAGFVREERGLSSARKRFVFTLVPLAADPGDLPRICLFAEDVTERRALDDEIAQSRKLRAVGELVGGIAHEFNNLLTPIMLKTSEIKMDWPHDHRLHQEIAIIAGAGQRGAELTRRLLTFGRKAEIRIETVQLAAVVDQSFALMRLTLDRRIQWHNAVPTDLPPLHLNVTDLNQVLANLILNARDTLLEKLAGQREGWTPTITVEASVEPLSALPVLVGAAALKNILGWQRLTVRDNGMGIEAAVRERIFEPFYTTKEVGKGTGLGLATVWHLIHEAGGRIEVESTPGGGSAFHIWLPMTPAPNASPVADPARPVTNTMHRRVFLADDDELVARTVTTILQRAGHAVHRVGDGAEAWQYLQEHHHEFALSILDVNMPGLDGVELAQRLRTKLNYAGKILIISGRLGSNDLREITQARVDAVLTKPFELKEFITTVETCLADRTRKA